MKTIRLISKEQNFVKTERITTINVPFYGRNAAGDYIKICDNHPENPNVIIVEPDALNPILNRKLSFSDVEHDEFKGCTKDEFMEAYIKASNKYETHLNPPMRISSNEIINNFLYGIKAATDVRQQAN